MFGSRILGDEVDENTRSHRYGFFSLQDFGVISSRKAPANLVAESVLCVFSAAFPLSLTEYSVLYHRLTFVSEQTLGSTKVHLDENDTIHTSIRLRLETAQSSPLPLFD
jgi:hypothetical protein